MRPSIYRNALTALLSIVASFFAFGAMAQLTTSTATQTTQTVATWIGQLPLATVAGSAAVVDLVPDDDTITNFQVIPAQFDPFKTNLVQAAWLAGIGCPTNATTAVFLTDGSIQIQGYSEPACTPGDPNDSPGRVQGLLLAKTGPTGNDAAAVARIVGPVRGKALTELGWDIRKPGADSM